MDTAEAEAVRGPSGAQAARLNGGTGGGGES